MQIVELEMVPLSLRPVLQRLYDMKTTQSALREGVLFSTKRNNYYYDTGTGKVIVLDDDTSYIFRVLFDPTLSAETFLISLTKVDPNAVKNLLQTIDAERLFQRPPLLSMGKEIAAGVTDTEQKVEQIILEVTEQCNFRCKYCVYSEDFSGNRDFGNRRMPTEIAFKAIDWALENSGAKLAITFYGGEPLLNFKLMKAVIERSQAKRGNKEIVYTVITTVEVENRPNTYYLMLRDRSIYLTAVGTALKWSAYTGEEEQMFTILEPGTGSDGSDSGEVSNVPDSKLVTKFIPAYEGNYTKDRKAQGGTISEITIHHCASILTIDALGALWQREGRKGSSHYGVSETNIGQYVHESDVAWTNGNWEANCRAVTIETSNGGAAPEWPVSDTTFQTLVTLVADIARRNGLGKLVKGKNLTWHSMYAATACPGPYLSGKLQELVDKANTINGF